MSKGRDRTVYRRDDGGTVMTTIHKFRADVDADTGKSVAPLLSDAENIFVLVDEAHRTEYGKFAAQMKMALPNACRIAFTGTPIAQHKKGRVTVDEFGSYIHKYTMPQSEADDARAQYYIEDLDLVDASKKIKALLDTHIRGEEVTQLLEPVPILSDRFQQEIEKLKSTKAKAKRMEHALRHVATEKYEQDPAFYESIKAMLERIIRERKEQRISEVEQFKLLTEQTDRVQQRARSATEADPYLGVIRRHYQQGAADGDEPTEQEQTLGNEILEVLKQECVIDWIDKPDVQREMRRKVKRKLRLAGCPADKIEELTTALVEVAQVRLGSYG